MVDSSPPRPPRAIDQAEPEAPNSVNSAKSIAWSFISLDSPSKTPPLPAATSCNSQVEWEEVVGMRAPDASAPGGSGEGGGDARSLGDVADLGDAGAAAAAAAETLEEDEAQFLSIGCGDHDIDPVSNCRIVHDESGVTFIGQVIIQDIAGEPSVVDCDPAVLLGITAKQRVTMYFSQMLARKAASLLDRLRREGLDKEVTDVDTLIKYACERAGLPPFPSYTDTADKFSGINQRVATIDELLKRFDMRNLIGGSALEVRAAFPDLGRKGDTICLGTNRPLTKKNGKSVLCSAGSPCMTCDRERIHMQIPGQCKMLNDLRISFLSQWQAVAETTRDKKDRGLVGILVDLHTSVGGSDGGSDWRDIRHLFGKLQQEKNSKLDKCNDLLREVDRVCQGAGYLELFQHFLKMLHVFDGERCMTRQEKRKPVVFWGEAVFPGGRLAPFAKKHAYAGGIRDYEMDVMANTVEPVLEHGRVDRAELKQMTMAAYDELMNAHDHRNDVSGDVQKLSGWRCETYVSGGRTHRRYIGPGGLKARSILEAQRKSGVASADAVALPPNEESERGE